MSNILGIRRPTLSRRAKRLTLLFHVVCAIGWLTYMVLVALLALQVRLSGDPDVATSVYAVLYYFNTVGGVGAGAVSILTLASGLVLAVAGTWGAVKYWWTIAKLAATLFVIVFGYLVLRSAIRDLGTMGDTTGARAEAELGHLVYGTLLGFAVLLFATVVSYLKPWGTVRRPGNRPVSAVPDDDGRLRVKVRRIVEVTDRVRAVELVGAGSRLLPAFTPGAHLGLHLPSGTVRHYSLCSPSIDRTYYRIAVLREDRGRGGSLEVHRLREGMELRIDPPRNVFPLGLHPSYLFVAGGIGITPIMAMLEQVDRIGLPWRLVYTGRSPSTMAYAAGLKQRWPSRVELYCTGSGPRPNLVDILARQDRGTAVYGCGPGPLLDSLRDMTETLRPDMEFHSEQFAPSSGGSGSGSAFDIETQSRGVVNVAPQQTALQALNEKGVAVEASCEMGVCGTCRLSVLEGDPVHPDAVGEAPSDRDFYPCVSRAQGRITLDV
ncbi:PDR/VanB family oxidoreductase [Salininema proteolyticum]|uniref:PDR/VanB family oxidoreductase n=1 Tax=Salininema proteolyticum TaxID=1607685 RepID=A0ABV8TV39_9ACTN